MKPLPELLAELVALRSLSGAEDGAAAYAADLLRAGGLDVERLGNSVLARAGGCGGPRLLLHSHLDTVPAGQDWDQDPWRARWDQDRLVGLGANDAKASAAAMMTALLQLAQQPSAPGEVWLALTACEETDNSGMAAVLARIGLPDGAVAGEPTGLQVVRAQAGLAILRAVWRGRSCHAAHVARVDHLNALLEAASDLAQLGSYLRLEGQHPLLGPSTVAPTLFHSGARHNLVPDLAEAVFDCRLNPPHDAAACRRALEDQLPNAQVSVQSERLVPVETPERHPLVQAALRCAGKSQAIGSSTLSDMALLPGVPAVKCGPGASERSHTRNEFVLRSELEAGARFYARLVPMALAALEPQPVAP